VKNKRGIRFLVSDEFGVVIIAWFALVLLFAVLKSLAGLMVMFALFLIASGIGIWSTIAHPEDWIVEIPVYRRREKDEDE
jgi:hypothetical protein